MKAIEDLLLKKLKATERKTVLILEDEKDFCSTMAEVFMRKGYQVFVESSVQGAKRKLQVLDFSKTKIDLAVVEDSSNANYSTFLNSLKQKYPDIKTVVVAEDAIARIQNATTPVLLKEQNLDNVVDAISDSINYSNEKFKSHLNNLREIERAENYNKALHRGLKPSELVLTPEEEAELKRNKKLISSRLAKKLLEVFKCESLGLRRSVWKELRHIVKITRFNLTFTKLKGLILKYRQSGRISITNKKPNNVLVYKKHRKVA